jgi:hypothetical protein
MNIGDFYNWENDGRLFRKLLLYPSELRGHSIQFLILRSLDFALDTFDELSISARGSYAA